MNKDLGKQMSHGDTWEKHIPDREVSEHKEHEVKVLFGWFEEP